MASGVLCDICGVEAPTRSAEFNQNVGMLVARRHYRVRGQMCKRCVHKNYWKMTGGTLAIGWLGTISLIIAPIFVLINTAKYLSLMGMPKVPEGAKKPVIDNAVTEKAFGLLPEIIERLNRKEDLHAVAIALAPGAGLTPGQLVAYVRIWAQNQRALASAGTPKRGFEVVNPVAAGTIPSPPARS